MLVIVEVEVVVVVVVVVVSSVMCSVSCALRRRQKLTSSYDPHEEYGSHRLETSGLSEW